MLRQSLLLCLGVFILDRIYIVHLFLRSDINLVFNVNVYDIQEKGL